MDGGLKLKKTDKAVNIDSTPAIVNFFINNKTSMKGRHTKKFSINRMAKNTGFGKFNFKNSTFLVLLNAEINDIGNKATK